MSKPYHQQLFQRKSSRKTGKRLSFVSYDCPKNSLIAYNVARGEAKKQSRPFISALVVFLCNVMKVNTNTLLFL